MAIEGGRAETVSLKPPLCLSHWNTFDHNPAAESQPSRAGLAFSNYFGNTAAAESQRAE